MEQIKKYVNTYITESNKKIYKNNLYNYILPEDIVNVEYKDDGCVIKELVSRKILTTIGIMRRNNFNCFIILPLISDIYSYPINNISHNGEVVLVKTTNSFDLDILGYYGNVTNFNNLKLAIRSLINTNSPILDLYSKNLPTLGPSKYTSVYQDLCHLDTFSVDPGGTKDVDDCISISSENKTIYVHIVDINKNLELGSINDLQALNKACSLYLVDNTVNCIKKSISKEKISLIKNEVRDVITIQFLVDDNNKVDLNSIKIYESKIINKYNYTYEEFNNKYNDEWIISFVNKWKLKTFDIPSKKLHINGNIINFSLNNNNTFAYKFIETMMIITNIIITNHLDNLKIKIPYKNHPKNFTDDLPNNLFDKYLLFYNSKNNLKSIENGHFGMSFINYTTFTSPIRKYNDILIHRILKGYIYTDNILNIIIEHIKNKEKLIKKISKWYFNIIFRKYLKYNWKNDINARVLSITNDSMEIFIEKWMFVIKTDVIIDVNVGDTISVIPKIINPYNLVIYSLKS